MEHPDPARLVERLVEDARALGVPIDAATAARLLTFGRELVRWNARVDLVGPTTLEGLARRHLLDALPLLPILHERGARRVIDLGSGAGLPGLVLALVDPGLEVVSIEPRGRRAAFQRQATRLLGLGRVQVVEARVTPGGVPPVAPADAVVARALAPVEELLALARPLVRPGGAVLAMLGPGDADARTPPDHTVAYRLPAEAGEAPRARRIAVFSTPR